MAGRRRRSPRPRSAARSAHACRFRKAAASRSSWRSGPSVKTAWGILFILFPKRTILPDRDPPEREHPTLIPPAGA